MRIRGITLPMGVKSTEKEVRALRTLFPNSNAIELPMYFLAGEDLCSVIKYRQIFNDWLRGLQSFIENYEFYFDKPLKLYISFQTLPGGTIWRRKHNTIYHFTPAIDYYDKAYKPFYDLWVNELFLKFLEFTKTTKTIFAFNTHQAPYGQLEYYKEFITTILTKTRKNAPELEVLVTSHKGHPNLTDIFPSIVQKSGSLNFCYPYKTSTAEEIELYLKKITALATAYKLRVYCTSIQCDLDTLKILIPELEARQFHWFYNGELSQGAVGYLNTFMEN